jgi:Protein of unknown function (DUF2948)
MDLLRLIALDEDDLKIISAQLQDALVRMDELTFLPKERRFVAMMRRFDWLRAGDATNGDGQFYERRQTALRFERVLGAQVRDLPLDNKEAVEALLAAHFEPAEPADPPSGFINLIFAGGGGIRLKVECIEAELRDLGPVWRTLNKPDHTDDAPDPQAAG